MSDSGIKDTTAYKIIRQMTDHIWGSDEKFEDVDVIAICRLFASRGGNWESLLNGAMNQAVNLEGCIKTVVEYRRDKRVASRIAIKSWSRVE